MYKSKNKTICKVIRYVQSKIQNFSLNKRFNTSDHFTTYVYSYCIIVSLWQRNYHWLILKHFKVNFFIYLHLDMNSLRVFRVGKRDLLLLPLISLSGRNRISMCNQGKGERLKLYASWFGVESFFHLVAKCA